MTLTTQIGGTGMNDAEQHNAWVEELKADIVAMTTHEFYERECELLDAQLEAGKISKQEHLNLTRRLRLELQDEIREAADRGDYE